MDDLLERLRRDILSNRCGCQLLREAADAIERKDKTIAALSGLFEKFMLHVYKCEGRNFVCDIDDSSEIKFTQEEVKALEVMSERVFGIKPD